VISIRKFPHEMTIGCKANCLRKSGLAASVYRIIERAKNPRSLDFRFFDTNDHHSPVSKPEYSSWVDLGVTTMFSTLAIAGSMVSISTTLVITQVHYKKETQV